MELNRVVVVGVCVLVAGCSRAYYSAMEKVGYEKRDILVSRVQKARDGQQDAKAQFQSALEQFQSVVKVDGGELEAKYDELKDAYDRSEERATDVRERVTAVAKVSRDLFREWDAEIKEMTDAELRRRSRAMLDKTTQRYERLHDAMKRAESAMTPVLARMKDQVLFLKHNLNAKAIAAIQTNLRSIETDVSTLVRDMEHAIAEADTFINSLSS